MQLQAQVICCDLQWNLLFLNDGLSVHYLSPDGLGTEFREGDLVEIQGVSAENGDAPKLTAIKATKLGRKAVPPAQDASLTNLTGTSGQWIQVNGRVVSANASRGRLILQLEDQGATCPAYVMGQPRTNDLKSFAGKKVRVRGINTSTIVDGKTTVASIVVPSVSEVLDEEPVPSDARQLPVWSVDALLNRELGPWTNELVHINGLVNGQTQDGFLVVKDPTGTIRARSAQTQGARTGDRVNVWGLLTILDDESILDQARCEVVSAPQQNDPAPLVPASRQAPSNLPPVLTTAAQIIKLSNQDADLHLPVRLRGVITYSDPAWVSAFFEDSTEALWVELGQTNARAGQWVELTGQTGSGAFAPVVRNAKAEIFGASEPPAPAKIDVEEAADGRFDSHVVEVQGVVRGFSVEDGHLWLNLTSRKGKFRAIIPGITNTPAALLDARVMVRGVCSSELNARHQLAGITLCAASLDQIKILEAADANAWSAAPVSVSSISTFNPDRMAGRRVKVEGVVTLTSPGRGFFIQDKTGGIRVNTEDDNLPQSGDEIEARGFPALGDFSPQLNNAVFRVKGHGTMPAPRKTTAENILRQGIDDGQVVELEARLLQTVPNAAQPKIMLQDGSIIFGANVMSRAAASDLLEFRAGSVVRVKGVCVVQSGESLQPEAFHLLIFEPQSVALISAPPLLGARQWLATAAVLAFVVLLVLGWVRLLRRQVQHQTEIIRAERNLLQDSQARLQLQFDKMPIACITWDCRLSATSWNPAAALMFGYTALEALGRNANEILTSPTPEPADNQSVEKLLTEDLNTHVVRKHRTKDGRIIFCDWTSTSLRGPDGAVTGTLSMVQDVTEQRHANLQLDYERNLLKTILDTIPDSIYFKDRQSRFVRVSKSKQNEFGIDLVGKTDFDTFDEGRARSAFNDEQEILETGKPIIGKIEPTVKPDGAMSWHLTSKMPWRNPHGDLIGTFGISKDITFIKEAEAKLAHVHKQLVETSRQAGMAEVATGVLHNVGNLLNSVNVSVNVLSEALKQSKTPNLAVIVSLLREHAADLGQFMTSDPRGSQLPRYLEHLAGHLASEQSKLAQEVASLARNIEHVKNIVAMQQNYAKIAGVQETIAASELVEDALQLHTDALERHKVRVLRDYDPKDLQVTVDRHKALAVLLNLIGNAKYACSQSPRADKQMKVSVANGGNRVRISIEDNGVGIPRESLSRIFTLGFTTRKDGHGFGLHNGALAAREMGGALVVQSEGPDQGAIFTLELPVNPHN